MNDREFSYKCTIGLLVLGLGVALNSCAASSVAEKNKRQTAQNPTYSEEKQRFAERSFSSPQESSGSTLSSQLQSLRCSDPSALKGVAISNSESDAMAQAQKEIALQIQASLEGLGESYRSSVRVGSQEEISRSWNSQVRQMTQLSNAQEARQEHVLKQGGQFGVLACMSRTAAARPFRDQFTVLVDSLNLATNTVITQNHPLRKMQSFNDAQSLFSRLLPVSGVLEGLGVLSDSDKQRRDADYRRMIEDFTAFKSRFALHWDDAKGPVASAIFAQLSTRYKLETGECVQGLRLSLETEPDCRSGAFGPTCTWQPSLQGRSCSGEVYFNLQATELRGIGKYEQEEALKRLATAVKSASFWNEWYVELDQWSIK